MVSWVAVVGVIGLALIALTAWGMWLLFNYVLAKTHGMDALKATPPVAEAFRPTEWMLPIKHRTTIRFRDDDAADSDGHR